MRAPLLLTLLICLLSPVHADAPDSALRTLSANDYLAAIPGIVADWHSGFTGDIGAPLRDDFYGVISNELKARYTPLETLDYPLLDAAYQALDAEAKHYADFTYYDRDRLNIALVLSKINERENNLNFFREIHSGDLHIQSTPRDFNADGQPEYVLDIVRGDCFYFEPACGGSYRRLLVVAKTASGSYQPLEAPLPWFHPYGSTWSDSGGFIQEMSFADLNHDGLPEWVLITGGISGNHQNHSYVKILQWRAGRLENSLAEPVGFHAPAGGGGSDLLLPYGVGLDIADGKLISRQLYGDNWGCTMLEIRVIGWQTGAYRLAQQLRLPDERLQGCAFRHAEEAMWEHDYTHAIEYYERGLTLPATTETNFVYSDFATLEQYARARLALAYILNGQNADAASVLHNMQSGIIWSEPVRTMVNLIDAALARGETPLTICRQLYRQFKAYTVCEYNFDTDLCGDYRVPMHAYVGYIKENVPIGWLLNTPLPENAGCDIFAFKPSAPIKPAPEPRPGSPHAMPAIVGQSFVIQAFVFGDYERAVKLADHVMAQPVLSYDTNIWLVYYYRALALELLHRDDEAAETYAFIRDHADRLGWRSLAALHLA